MQSELSYEERGFGECPQLLLLVVTNNILMLTGEPPGRNKTDCVPLGQTDQLGFGFVFGQCKNKTHPSLKNTDSAQERPANPSAGSR